MPDQTPPKSKTSAPSHVDPETKSQILQMIQSHISLASRLTPVADVDTYSKGDSPGPVDQYSKGSSVSLMDEVSNPGLREGLKESPQTKTGNIAGKQQHQG